MAERDLSAARVLVVDDNDQWRGYLLTRLHEERIEVVGIAFDGEDAVQQALALQPDLVLMDIRLPGISGIEAARRIWRGSQTSEILFVSNEADPGIVRAAFNAGGRGYVLKALAAIELIAGMKAVLRGEPFVSSGLKGLE
jgi:DNA-binding NarL/FixJ family response regulator